MKNTKKHFPFQVPRPKDMSNLDKVLCMVYLAQNCTLDEIRMRQGIVEEQFSMAIKRNLPVDNLLVMRDNLDAAIAYQQFPEDDMWVSFIK